MKTIEIFIVDDHSLIIEGLQFYFQKNKSYKVVGYANDAASCVRYFKERNADVAIIDINLPDMSGLELCKELHLLKPQLKIIALSTHNHTTYVKLMLQNGASAYLLKNSNLDVIDIAIEQVMQNKIYLSEELLPYIKLDEVLQNTKPLLTKRETEILKLIVEGKTNMEIRKALFISIDTVDTHRKNLYSKLGVNNIAQLVKYVLENGIL